MARMNESWAGRIAEQESLVEAGRAAIGGHQVSGACDRQRLRMHLVSRSLSKLSRIAAGASTIFSGTG